MSIYPHQATARQSRNSSKDMDRRSSNSIQSWTCDKCRSPCGSSQKICKVCEEEETNVSHFSVFTCPLSETNFKQPFVFLQRIGKTSPSWKCLNCDYVNPAATSICKKCLQHPNQNLTRGAAISRSETWKCRECGKQNKCGLRSCSKCFSPCG